MRLPRDPAPVTLPANACRQIAQSYGISRSRTTARRSAGPSTTSAFSTIGTRRSADLHIPVALLLTKGRHYTFPVIELEGQRIGDSSAIIAALEQRYPDPPLYPEDPGERDGQP